MKSMIAVRLSRRALRDIQEIDRYSVETWGEQVASKYLEDLYDGAARLVQNAVAGRQIVLSGTGQQTRAWCHVDDFVDGLVRCLAMREAKDQVFNLGNPAESFTMLELANAVCDVVGARVPIIISGSTEPDVLSRSPDISKAETLLGFKPEVSLRAGIERFVTALASRNEMRCAA